MLPSLFWFLFGLGSFLLIFGFGLKRVVPFIFGAGLYIFLGAILTGEGLTYRVGTVEKVIDANTTQIVYQYDYIKPNHDAGVRFLQLFCGTSGILALVYLFTAKKWY